MALVNKNEMRVQRLVVFKNSWLETYAPWIRKINRNENGEYQDAYCSW